MLHFWIVSKKQAFFVITSLLSNKRMAQYLWMCVCFFFNFILSTNTYLTFRKKLAFNAFSFWLVYRMLVCYMPVTKPWHFQQPPCTYPIYRIWCTHAHKRRIKENNCIFLQYENSIWWSVEFSYSMANHFMSAPDLWL